MNTRALRLLVSLLLLQPIANAARAQTADDVVEKHLAALGGRDALGKITSRKNTGTVSVTIAAGVIPGVVEAYAKAPNKSRVYMKLDLSGLGAGEVTTDQRFDGTAGFGMNSMSGDAEITGNQLENMRSNAFPSSLLRYKEAGAKLEVLPKEKVGDRDAIVLLLTPKTGSPVRMYLDAETYLIAQTIVKVNAPQMGGDIEQKVQFTDYRPVDGVMVPFHVANTTPAQTLTITLTKVEQNIALDDAMFAKRQAPGPLTP